MWYARLPTKYKINKIERLARTVKKDILKFVSEKVVDDRKISMIFEKVLNERSLLEKALAESFYTREKDIRNLSLMF